MAIKGRILTRFPMRIVGGPGTTVSYTGGVLTVAGAAGASIAGFSFESRAAAILVPANASATYVRTAGYYSAGDGGHALYKRVVSEPTHEGKFQSSDGVWFEYVKQDEGVNVRQFGAKNDGTNCATAIQNAINFLEITYVASDKIGGVVFIPAGNWTLNTGLTITASFASIRIVGEGVNATFLRTNADITMLNVSGSGSGIEHLSCYGCGSAGDTGTLGTTAVNHCIVFAANAGMMLSVRAQGGASAIHVTAFDAMLLWVQAGTSYGSAVVTVTGSCWYERCAFDHGAVGIASTSTRPYSARANATLYAAGNVVSVSGYLIICTVGGTSGGSNPTLKNYGVNITDGTVTWQLWAPVGYQAMTILAGALENRAMHCDFSGEAYEFSTSIGSGFVSIAGGVTSAPVAVTGGSGVHLCNNSIGGYIQAFAGFTGQLLVEGNTAVGATNIDIGAGVSNFRIIGNYLAAGTITVAAGASDHYDIVANGNAVIVDGGTGTHKTIHEETRLHTSGAFVLGGLIAPAQIASNQNNYAPTGLATASRMKINSDAARDITGLSATGISEGQTIFIRNNGSFSITLKHNSGSSSAGNQFWFNADYVLVSLGTVTLLYADGFWWRTQQ